MNKKGMEQLKTTRVLHREVESAADDWGAPRHQDEECGGRGYSRAAKPDRIVINYVIMGAGVAAPPRPLFFSSPYEYIKASSPVPCAPGSPPLGVGIGCPDESLNVPGSQIALEKLPSVKRPGGRGRVGALADQWRWRSAVESQPSKNALVGSAAVWFPRRSAPPAPLLPKCCSAHAAGPAISQRREMQPLPVEGGGGRRCERGFIRGVPRGAGTSRFLETTMAIGLAVLELLAFLLGCLGTFAEPQNSEPAAKCSLTGTWKNDLNSTMEINSVSNTGVFSGLYKTAVSVSGRPIQPSRLQGIQHQGPQPTFGFTIKWNFHESTSVFVGQYLKSPPSESTSVFVGQYLRDKNGEEQLKTTWLLREKVESTAEDWGATWVGSSTFYRSE